MQSKPNSPPLACLAKALEILSMICVCLGFSASADTNKPPTQTPKSVAEQARDLMKSSKNAVAESVIIKHLHVQPNAADAAECAFLLGQIQVESQRYDAALRTFSNTFSRYPKTEWAAQSMAEQIPIHLQRRNPGAAQKCREELLRHHPKSPTTVKIWSEIGDQYFDEQKFKDAVQIYQSIEPSLSKEASDKLTLARVFSDGGGDPSKLIDIAEKAMDQNRSSFARSIYEQISKSRYSARHLPQIHTRLGWCLYLDPTKENLTRAETLWRQVIKSTRPSDPWYAQSKWHLVQLASGHQGDWKKAVAICQEIEREQPVGSLPHEQALFSRAWLLTVQEQGQAAVDAFDQLIADYPEKGRQPVIIQHRERALAGLTKKKSTP
jgi:outer membrane protein assembly factor BamD (BamD/ComL family)